jgi:uncharacterized damage-inducible protein DinB
MPKLVAVAPTYATGDLARILEIEQWQIEDTVTDLTEEQMHWRPTPKAKSALDILWHLAYAEARHPMPRNKVEALEGLSDAYSTLQRDIATAGKLDEPIEWHTGDTIPYRGAIWAAIRHRTYHLGELVYLRQVMGLDEPKYYHEA